MLNKHKLPESVKPIKYQLIIKPDLTSFVFSGDENISINILKPTKQLILHAKELKVTDVKFEFKNSVQFAKKIVFNEKSETVTIIFANSLPKGTGELSLKFTGVLNDKMRGFYRSRYVHEGQEKHLATTQFEATDARRAFPCFDEPAQKAVFDVSVIVPKNLSVVSNTEEQEYAEVPEHGAGFKMVKFSPTPKMSTYLLAFIVGDLEFVQSKTKRGVVVRVFTTPGKKHQAKFALDCATKTLDFYEKYFDIKYPLPLLDMIAIPDFTSGAMENWGAITYRESALLVDENHSATANKQWVALVIAHEIAHQWFGNLVTMHWWTDLWLNEGFASYIEYLAVDKIFPNWDIWTQFMNADLGPAMKLDALNTTHPIEVEVKHPDEIGEIFDAVSYSKGASVIRMLAEYLGEKDFKMGLRMYLKKHAYSNTQTLDLWKALEKVSKKPVLKIMQGWTKKPGYPVIKVERQLNSLSLTQSRFYSSRISKAKDSGKTIWQVPVNLFDNGRLTKILLSNKRQNISIGKTGIVKLNYGEIAMFRTEYSTQMLYDLMPFVGNKKLSVLDRLGLVRDAFALCESGQLNIQVLMDFLLAYKNESDFTVWSEISGGLSKLQNLFFSTEVSKDLNVFILQLFDEIVKKVGWKKGQNEPHTTAMLRSMVLYQAGASGHVGVIDQAKKMFEKQNLDPDIRSLVYRLVAENGNAKEWLKLQKMYVNTDLHEEKNRIGAALASFKQQSLLKKTLEFSKSAYVRAQDMPSILVVLWQNVYGKNLAWQFVQKNIKYLMDRFALGGHMLSRILGSAGTLVSDKQAREFEQFFKHHPAPGANRTISQVLEKIYSNAVWLKTDLPKLVQYFKQHNEK